MKLNGFRFFSYSERKRDEKMLKKEIHIEQGR